MKKAFIILLLLVSRISFAENLSVQFNSGLALINEEKYAEAISVLEKSIDSLDIRNQALCYFLIGLANTELENFSGALNSLETALDLSTDTKLDAKIDEQIDKTIQLQNFAEAGKNKNRLSYYAGAGYDSNLLNLNKDNFTGIDLSSYSAIYGLNLSHSLIRNMNYQVTPEVALSDSYSVNTTLSAESTIQSSDALQLSFLLPAQFRLDLFSDHDSFSPQVGVKTLYLPTDTAKRSLAFTSVFLTFKSIFNVAESYIFAPQLSYSMDKSSLTYADSADDQSANRITLDLNNSIVISEDRHQVNINLTGEQNTATGDNSTYTKIAAGLELRLSVIPTYNIGLITKYTQTDYTKRTTERNDRQNSVGLDVSKNFSADQSLTFNFASSSRSSNSTTNAYQDMTVSVIFADAFSF